MEFLIITGLSGGGKSQAADIIEDLDYYCVDNMPVALIPKFAELCAATKGRYEKVALVTDIREKNGIKDIFNALETLREMDFGYKILFMEAKPSVIVKRYKESRRPHPLAAKSGGSIEDAILKETEQLRPIRDIADYIIDTSHLTLGQLHNELYTYFSDSATDRAIMVNVMSFGYKHGLPMEADLVFDVRFLPNPFYVEDLRPLCGLDRPVAEFVFSYQQTRTFMEKIEDMLDFLLPIYGSGAIIILFVTLPVADNLWLVYVLGMLAATLLEYVVGAVMEQLFKVRYWDYTKQPCNLHGYICLTSSIAWGFFSILLVRFIHPPIDRLLHKLPDLLVNPLAGVIAALFIWDTVKSTRAAIDLREVLTKLTEENEELRKLAQKAEAAQARTEEELRAFREKTSLDKYLLQAYLADELEAHRTAKRVRKQRRREMVENAFRRRVESKLEVLSNIAQALEKTRAALDDGIDEPGEKELAIARGALAQVGIADMENRSYGRLSGGEQQLVLIARALAQQTELLIMDEPTSSLDYGNQLRVMQRVRALARQGYTILLSSHNPQQALLFSDRILALHDGVICADGTPEKVITPELLETLYSIKTRLAEAEEGRLIIPLLKEDD